jgi:uncharacterized protein
MNRAADRPPLWQQALWAVAAFASTMCGIGGGLFAVPILHFLGGLPLKTSVNTSLVLVFVMTLTATVAELFQPTSGLDWRIVAALALGGFFGARLGHQFSKRVNPRTLAKVFVVMLTLAGLRVLFGGGPREAVSPSTLSSVLALFATGVIGVVGGFISPLLGIGGGLIVVPALYLGLGTSYLTARACSTAMSVVNAGQLTWVNVREGNLNARAASWFGAGAFVGAVAGVVLVHQQGWAEAARVLLGVMLIGIAARFAWDLRRGARQGR